MMIPFSNMTKFRKTSGVDGDLIITSGNNVTLPAGSVKQYRNIRIDAGGLLIISGSSFIKTEIACQQDFILNGNIIARYDGIGGSLSGNTVIENKPYSLTVTQANGGNGGTSNWQSGLAGLQLYGNGGGGAGGGAGNNTTNGFVLGGNGGNNSNGGAGNAGVYNNASGSTMNYGAGGSKTGASGTNGANGTVNNTQATNASGGSGGAGGGAGGGGGSAFGVQSIADYCAAGGGGGGGGKKGLHGNFLFLYLEGGVSGAGYIGCYGTAGFVGGNGGNGAYKIYGGSFSGGYWGGGGGGGGGGGAGGSGGHIILYKRRPNPVTFVTDVSAGNGLAGGSGGVSVGYNVGGTANSGTSGSNGYIGSVNINDI